MNNRNQRRAKIRKTIKGTAIKPRLVVFRSNRYVYAQLVDDVNGKTLVSIDKLERAEDVGKLMAERAKKLKIANVVFDRAGYKYHGKVKQIADSAREGGLQF